MKTAETYLWRTLWAGKWSTTRYHATEEEIRRRHPEAVRVEGSLVLRQVPETDEEKRDAYRNTSAAHLGGSAPNWKP